MDPLMNDFDITHLDTGTIEEHNTDSQLAPIYLKDGEILEDTQLRQWEVVQIDTTDPLFIQTTKGLAEGYVFANTMIEWTHRCQKAMNNTHDILNKYYKSGDIKRMATLPTFNDIKEVRTSYDRVLKEGVSALPREYKALAEKAKDKKELLDIMAKFIETSIITMSLLIKSISNIPIYFEETDIPKLPKVPGTTEPDTTIPKTPMAEVLHKSVVKTQQAMQNAQAFPSLNIQHFGDVFDPWRNFVQQSKQRRQKYKKKRIVIRRR